MHAGRKEEEECYFQVRIERFSVSILKSILFFEDREKEKNPCNNKSWKQVFKVKTITVCLWIIIIEV